MARPLRKRAVTYGLSERQTSDLLIESSIGSLLLAKGRNGSLREIVASVSSAGGLTEVGVATIRQELPAVLEELKHALECKQEQRLQQSSCSPAATKRSQPSHGHHGSDRLQVQSERRFRIYGNYGSANVKMPLPAGIVTICLPFTE